MKKKNVVMRGRVKVTRVYPFRNKYIFGAIVLHATALVIGIIANIAG